MSERQIAREQRKRLHWAEKYAAARSEDARLLVAFDEIRAAVEDLPKPQRDPARQAITAHLRQIAGEVTQRTRDTGVNSQRPGHGGGSTRPGATRARARRQV